MYDQLPRLHNHSFVQSVTIEHWSQGSAGLSLAQVLQPCSILCDHTSSRALNLWGLCYFGLVFGDFPTLEYSTNESTLGPLQAEVFRNL
eukprot:2935595-Amphidinium_carterae.1